MAKQLSSFLAYQARKVCSVVEMSAKITWSRVSDADQLSRPVSRSSHGLSAVGDVLYLFGGEHLARSDICLPYSYPRFGICRFLLLQITLLIMYFF
jgi:hypothetical protein